MKLIAPDYYTAFKCTADKCRHSCCIGWEIDINKEALDYYNSLGGELGQKLKTSISQNGETASFILSADERCPFLQADGLCEIICKLGEAALCDICSDHPRFRNFYADRTEIGLGLCCEAAAELILQRTQPARLITLSDDETSTLTDEEETALLLYRKNLIAIAQDREFTVDERIENLLLFCGLYLPRLDFKQWADTLRSLERLDTAWDEKLSMLENAESSAISSTYQTAFEQLLVYFLYRHVPAALYDGDINSKVLFAIISTKLLSAIYNTNKNESLTELARMFSSEIEYSDENLNKIFDKINGA